MNKLGGFIRLMRPVNCTMMGFAVLVGAVLAAASQFSTINWFNIIFGFLTGFTFCAAAMVINDYYDRNIDSINEPNRPIPSGLIKTREALAFMAVSDSYRLRFCYSGTSASFWCSLLWSSSGFSGYNCNIHYRWQTKWVAWKLFGQHLRCHPVHLRQHNRNRNRWVKCVVVCFHGFPFEHGQRNHKGHR